MEVVMIDFEKSLILNVKGEQVKLTVFKTPEHGNIKMGVDAPQNVSVNREEIFLKKREQW